MPTPSHPRSISGPINPSMMTDMYEYTMLDATLRDGTANRDCVFEVFTRHLPEGRRYGVVAGIGRLLDELEAFHPSEADLRFLSDRHIVDKETITWLENYHFNGTIRGYREGEAYFPNSPILQVEGTFGECTLLETLILSILNYDSAVAAAASRMTSAAKNRPCMDMGGRRTNEWAAVAAARASIVGGFKGTANLLAAQLYGLTAIGTAAHCFTLVHDSERAAFESQIAALGKNTTLLVDTYNIEEAVRTASSMLYVSTSSVVFLPSAAICDSNAARSLSCTRVKQCAAVPIAVRPYSCAASRFAVPLNPPTIDARAAATAAHSLVRRPPMSMHGRFFAADVMREAAAATAES